MTRTQESTKATAREILDSYRRGCNGTATYHRPGLPGLGISAYTDGVRILADAGEAHWLVDVVCSWQPEIRRHYGPGAYGFQVWLFESGPTAASNMRMGRPDLTLPGDIGGPPMTLPEVERCDIVATAWSDTPYDRGSQRLAAQAIPSSDLPRCLLPLRLWVEGDVLLLPEEH